MITAKELLEKSKKAFPRILSSEFKGVNIFPWTVPSDKSITATGYTPLKEALVPLHTQSKANAGKGYSIEWTQRKINGIKQKVPSRIFFETLQDYLAFTGNQKAYSEILRSREALLSHFPSLQDWCNDHSLVLFEYANDWPEIIKVLTYFIKHAPPHPYFIRELPIAVHSKFIEDNVKLLRIFLDLILPAMWKNTSSNNFEERYFLKKASIYTQIRVLDDDLKPHLGYDSCSLSLEDAAWLEWRPEKVFIIENKTCYYTFPKVKNAIAIFGEGFKSKLTHRIPWLGQTTIYCWYDLDAAGFEMLNMIRQYYPKAKSLLMDFDTYNSHQQFSVTNKYRVKDLPALTSDEQELYKSLIANNKRLEQERIGQSYVLSRLP